MAPLPCKALLGLLLTTASIPLASASIPDEEISKFNTAGEDTGAYSVIINEVQRTNNETLLWGPYRPQVYFGVKPRLPDSFIGGLMWAGVDNFFGIRDQFRHTCEQDDDLDGYGWEEYDVRKGGRQVVKDKGNKIDLEMEWRKVKGGQHGGHWGVRIKGTPRPDAPKDVKTALWFYAGLEGEGNIELVNEEDPLGLEGDVTLAGQAPGLEKFRLTVTTGPHTNEHPESEHEASLLKPLDRTLYKAFDVPTEYVWKTRDILFMHIQEYLGALMKKYGKDNHPPAWNSFTLANEFEPGNLHMMQKVFVGAFEFDILFSSESAETPMTSELLTKKINSFKPEFEARFNEAFQLQEPFDTPEYKEFAKNMFSNLAGGIGYFHGTTLVDKSDADEYAEEEEGFWEGASEALKNADAQFMGPYSLFTSIPSRPFFPRGFYWDEGFQLLPILEWDVDLCLEIIRSWFSLVDEDGWIAREQILGDEARSKVPAEFQVQYPHHANPPTLFLAITDFILKFEAEEKKQQQDSVHMDQPQQVLGSTNPASDPRTAHLSRPLAIHFLKTLYPSLRRHYDWFRRTQAGDLKTWTRPALYPKEAYRWRSRTPDHCLASGLDDYPRPQPPHTGELHVDLISWVSVMTRCLRKIAIALGDEYAADVKELLQIESFVNKNLNALHWSEEHKTYCDITVDDYEESIHVCHKGYISLFPFLVGGIIPPDDGERLKAVLDLMADPEELWSPYGLRSLSKSDPYFSTGENYWRGPIWININYLALRRLLEYARVPGPCQKQARQMYLDLRKNVVENVYKEWKRTGFAWEQYDQGTGEGRRTKHFLGWTSLVVKMMSMPGKVSLVQKEYVDWAV
ncbi:glycoside hydrolase [Kalaharituber pfeilii]|nr:glycoside hydrolase [Kalaharituber pfeilii]